MIDVIRKMVAAINDLPHCAVHGDAMRFALAAAESAGWKLVPVEPTEEMMEAYWVPEAEDAPEPQWSAMLAAAPRWEP